MSIKEKLELLGKNSIRLKIEGKETYKLGATRFGGQPDVPADFVWPAYEGESYDNVVKDRPLTFLPGLTRSIFCPTMACSPSSMKQIPSAGAMTLKIRAAPAFIGLRTFRPWPLRTFLRIWRMISGFLWSGSKWIQKTPILPGRISVRCSRMRRMTTLSTRLGRN